MSGPGILAPGTPRPISESFSAQIQLDHNAVQVVPSSSGNLVLSLKPGGTFNEGVSKTIKIPAGNATGIASASLTNLNIVGDPFNSSHDMEIVVGYNGG